LKSYFIFEKKLYRGNSVIMLNTTKLKNFFVESTIKTPQIDLNHLTGELILSGKSIPENAIELYDPVLKWVYEYRENPRSTTNLRLNLEYFNTASSIFIAKIVKALCSISLEEATLIIHIYFHIEEFDSMAIEDLRDAISPVLDMIGSPVVSLAIKIYGTDENNEVIKESMVLV